MTTAPEAVPPQATEPVALPRPIRTTIYCAAAPLAVGLLDIADKPLDAHTIIHAGAVALASLGAIVAAAHISGK